MKRQQKISIAGFTAPALSQHGPIELQLHLQNLGNVHAMPTGSIAIYDMFGRHTETLPLPNSIILPKTTKTLPITWDNKKIMGYYTAVADIAYGTEQQKLSSLPVHMWILPWLYTVGVVIGLGIVGVIVWRTRGRWRRTLRVLLGTEDASV